ncbi:MAG: hypothetical protein JWM78_2962 [Verrucomicrobiaceae bacterium]|nr:hypothetical protein [Verrucomicrobiaceae bacterium]
MSLILDALKKSERERQREKTPDLQSIHQPLPRREVRSRRHLWIIAAVVFVNAAVLMYWRLQQPSLSVAANSIAAKSAEPAVTNAPLTEAKKIIPAVPGVTTNATPDEYTRIAPTQNAAAQTSAVSDLRIEEVSELPEDVRNNLPAMTFSFHVYSTNPQQRTIIINNKRMREGDEVSSGLQLQTITDDGVILLYAAHRIHISVLSGW